MVTENKRKYALCKTNITFTQKKEPTIDFFNLFFTLFLYYLKIFMINDNIDAKLVSEWH